MKPEQKKEKPNSPQIQQHERKLPRNSAMKKSGDSVVELHG